MPPTPAIPVEEIAARFRAAGIVPPDERAQGTYGNASRLLEMLHWLRRSRTMADEPAHVMSLMGWMK